MHVKFTTFLKKLPFILVVVGGDLNVFEKSRGSQRKIWHHMLFITHVRGTWIEIINERVPCFCNLPDSMKVITLLGK